MRFRGLSIGVVGAAMLLLTVAAPEAGAQRGRIGVLRSPPRPQTRLGGRPRLGVIAPNFFNTCFVVPSMALFPFFGGGLPFLNVEIFAGGQPWPDPNSHLAPDPGAQPMPFPGSHAAPDLQPLPGVEPVPGAIGMTNLHAGPVFAVPAYNAPVYSAPVYGAAAPAPMPQVSDGMVVGGTIDDPTFGLSGRSASWFGGGGTVSCVSHRALRRTVFLR